MREATQAFLDGFLSYAVRAEIAELEAIQILSWIGTTAAIKLVAEEWKTRP